ncbi:hypothetical protein K458DRAFT_416895 [Lentithecium fluviatile CBS 122367]|uniref:THUMP domain-containing protein n=1 Tax=Lentithecium fluviatile CBS 122367 TaxID=1168545 RepID=A0A6G1J654_9PLEO|nr:hypothetical protein K458DRAFT_416895 [Lentithecium fluviatile CBS 122367]
MDGGSKKRKADATQGDPRSNKRPTGKKKWGMPRWDGAGSREIQPGDVGIWVSCARGKEAPSVADLHALFQEYASQLYELNQTGGSAEDGNSDNEEGDIESEIKKEIEGIRKPTVDPLFRSAKVDTECLAFFKTRAPVEPVSFIHKICEDTANGVEQQRCRFVRRLTPITAIEKATEKGLEDVARQVIAPHFHGPEQAVKKFAIRTSIRNNKEFSRNEVIKRVADVVGDKHKVDLSGYDLLILVEIFKNVVGMSVVGPDFEKLRRFNLAELRDASNGNDQKVLDRSDQKL